MGGGDQTTAEAAAHGGRCEIGKRVYPSVCRSVRPSILPSAAFIFIVVLLLLLVADDVIRIAGMETNGELEREREPRRREGRCAKPAGDDGKELSFSTRLLLRAV